MTRPTLKDIAALADLSVASVSMALRNSPNVSRGTIARVKEIAHSLGYRPDPTLSALATYRKRLNGAPITAALALITNWRDKEKWITHPNPRLFVARATERAAELGYSLQHFWAREGGITPRRFNQILQARGIRGVLLAPPEHPADELELEWDRYSVMCLERPGRIGPFDFVEPDQYHAIALCWEHLQARGYRRPGLVVDEYFTARWGHRWEAAHGQLQLQHCPRSQRVPTLVVTEQRPVDQIRSWLRKHQADAVINRSLSFAAAVTTEGLSIPGDLGYVSLNTDADRPDASGITQRFDLLGQLAIDQLHRRLLTSQRGPGQIAVGTQVCGSWRDGTTLPDARLSAGDHHDRATVRSGLRDRVTQVA
ncbi:MAG: LacI family DNA-binding transcriptional regulator [Opitutaceae bacterium]|nr:LacI family DNA-binding transcriptional regulator [Opitutaceae bacterium]